MSIYTRRFTENPGLDVLLEIESVNIIDETPPKGFIAKGSGTALLLGEFENGPFETPTEVVGTTDLLSVFGNFGYTYSDVTGSNPSARSRLVDGTIHPEYWNGNGMVALNGKKFAKLLIVRVDTSVGSVSFSRLASIPGIFRPTYDLEPGQTLSFSTDTVGPTTVTFAAAAAQVTGVGGVFAGVVAGDYIDLAYDAETTIRTTFLTGDTTIAKVVSRINQAFGFNFAADDGTGELQLTGRIRGTDGLVNVVGGSGAIVATFGLAVGAVAGSGSVPNIDQVTIPQLNALIVLADPNVGVVRAADNRPLIYNLSNTGVASIEVHSTSTAIDFGFTLDDPVTQTSATEDVLIPAGTRVRNAAAEEWVTMQDITAVAGEFDGWEVKVRPADDDGTSLAALAGTVNVVPFSIAGGLFTVSNPLPLSAALSEHDLDLKYLDALEKTLDLNTIARESNLIWSARQSNLIRRALVSNAALASSVGCRGRMAVIRPPKGTTRTQAEGIVEPGVQAYRFERDRAVYTYPMVRAYMPGIAKRGTAGGVGFTSDGFIDIGSDGFMVSVCSRLAAEQNPGQLTTFLNAIVDLESGDEYRGWVMDDYIKFKKVGIAAPRLDEGIAIFQSGITVVDPVTTSELTRISRRRMADEIQDNLALLVKEDGKRLNTKTRRDNIVLKVDGYLHDLKTNERIEGYEIDPNSANTPTLLGAGMYIVKIKVRTFASLDSIVFSTSIGEQVTIEEVTQ